MSYIPEEHKNIYDEILAWPVCNKDNYDKWEGKL
jgi:hypothetical protein